MAAYTDSQIEDMAKQIADAGHGSDKVEAFIALARSQQQKEDNERMGIKPPPVDNTASPLYTLKQAAEVTGGGLRDIGMEAGAAATGHAIGAMTGVAAPIAMPILGGLGGAGAEGIRQVREGEFPQWGKMAESFIVNAPPGGELLKPVKRALTPLAEDAAKFIAANFLGKTAQTAIDEGRAPNALEQFLSVASGTVGAKIKQVAGKGAAAQEASERMVNDAVTNQNVKDWQAVGGKVDPTLTYRESGINQAMTELSGGATNVQRKANEYNQRVINKLAREDIQFPKDNKLDAIHVTDHIRELSKPMEEIKSISPSVGPKFADILENIQDTRAEARAKWMQYKSPTNEKAGTPSLRKEAQALDTRVDGLERSLETLLTNAGFPELTKEYKAARRLVSKAMVVRDSLVEGNVSAPFIASVRDKNRRNLDGGLELIARSHDTMPKVMREISDVQAPSAIGFQSAVSASGAGALAFMGAGGAGSGLPGQIAAGTAAALMTPKVSRAAMMSPLYQRVMSAPRYGVEDPAFAANLARFAGQAALR